MSRDVTIIGDAQERSPGWNEAMLDLECGRPYRALAWLERGAGAGDISSMVMLARIHGTGRHGVPLDQEVAFGWWLRAAEAGDHHAQYVAGCCLNGGAGTVRDLPRARAFLNEAKAGGHPLAAMRLLSVEGLGWYFDLEVETDLARIDTADQANPVALRWLGEIHEDGRKVPRDAARARAYYRRAVAAGDIEAMWHLGGRLCDEGKPAEGMPLLQGAAEAGHAHAQFRLGEILDLGEIVPMDTPRARLWYERAAASDHPIACTNLGYLHGQELLEDSDPAEAVRWYERAARLGEPGAMLSLAVRYMTGKDVPQDYELARFYAEPAADRGVAHAEWIMFCLYDGGLGGLAADEEEAEGFLRRAAEHGEPDAIDYLAQCLEAKEMEEEA